MIYSLYNMVAKIMKIIFKKQNDNSKLTGPVFIFITKLQ